MTLSIKNNKTLPIKYIELFWLLFISSYALNLFHIGEFSPILLVPYLTMLLIKKEFSNKFIFTFILLISFTSTYSLLIYYYGFVNISGVIGRFCYPLIFMLLGYHIIGNTINYTWIFKILFYLITSTSLYGILSVFKTQLIYGNMENAVASLGGRLIIDIWGENYITATALNAYLSLGLSLLPILILLLRAKININRIYIFILFIVFLASCYATTMISSRTGYIIVFLSLITVLLFSQKISKKTFQRIFTLLIVFFIIAINYFTNFFNIKTKVESSYMFNRFMSFDIQNDTRLISWKKTFIGLFENPLGGRVVELEAGYAHNLWLDVGYDGGIVPFLLITIFTLISLITLIDFLKNRHSYIIKGIIVSLFTAFFTIFMFEPVLQGLVLYFTIFCIVVGMIFKLNYLKRMSTKNS